MLHTFCFQRDFYVRKTCTGSRAVASGQKTSLLLFVHLKDDRNPGEAIDEHAQYLMTDENIPSKDTEIRQFARKLSEAPDIFGLCAVEQFIT